MSILQNRIPVLPQRPRVRPIPGKIHHSYPSGKQNYSRAIQGQDVVLTIIFEKDASFTGNIRANLITTLTSEDGKTWNTIPFTERDSCTLVCKVKANHPGLHSFRAEFSFDDGTSWMRDSVADAWIIVDPAQLDGLRMYTLIPNVSGTISDWTNDLKRIKGMGFNAVHLLPLTTLDTSESPYSARDLFNVDPRYLSSDSSQTGPEQLEEFALKAKELGIRLCFDLVLNHVGVHSHIARQAPDWIVPDPAQPDGFQRARYFADTGWFSWDDLILIHYDHPSEAIKAEIWAYMTGYALFWARYASITGGLVRFDNLHSSNPAFIKNLTETLHSVYPQVAILAEYFTDETTLINTGLQWGLTLNLATPWDYKFVPKLREYLKNIHRLSKHLRFFMPITSHDSGSPAQEFGSAGSTVPRYVAAALLGTGATGIVQGVEFGIEKKIDFIGEKPKLLYPEHTPYESFIRRVNAILSENPAFRHGGNCRFVDNGHPAVIAGLREEDAGGFLVVCNFDIQGMQDIHINLWSSFSMDGPFSCQELLSGETMYFSGPNLELRLPPCSALVLKFSKNWKCN